MHHVLFNVLYDISKLLVMRDCRKPRFWAKRAEIGQKSRKMGKLFFTVRVSFFNECVAMQCVQYRASYHI